MNRGSSTISEIQGLPSSAISAMNLPFKKGEKVVYPAHGVAVIEDIQMRVISGTERRFYMLRILGTEKMTIMIPTENVESVGLRRVIGKDMVEKIYRILRQRKVEVDTQTWNRRYREYTEKIKTGSPLEIAKVLRDLLVLKGDKELSFGERKMLDTARACSSRNFRSLRLIPKKRLWRSSKRSLRISRRHQSNCVNKAGIFSRPFLLSKGPAILLKAKIRCANLAGMAAQGGIRRVRGHHA